jgi:hypothetical protein
MMEYSVLRQLSSLIFFPLRHGRGALLWPLIGYARRSSEVTAQVNQTLES